MHVETIITTQRTCWVWIEADELHRIVSEAAAQAAGVDLAAQNATATTHFSDGTCSPAPSRRSVHALVELTLIDDQPASKLNRKARPRSANRKRPAAPTT